MKYTAVILMLCVLCSIPVNAGSAGVMYDTEIILTSYFSSALITPVFDEEWRTRRIKDEVYSLAGTASEYILERIVRDGVAVDDWQLRADSTVYYSENGGIKVEIRICVLRNGLLQLLDIEIVQLGNIVHSVFEMEI